MTNAQRRDRTLYVITCATPAATRVGTLVSLAQERGWTVCVIATPQAVKFLDITALERQTGFPVRSEYKQPGTPDVLPPADAMIAGGASFNTVNKWAQGNADNLALGLLTEAVGLGLPLVALPFLNAAQAAHPAFHRSIKELRDMGVKVLVDDEGYRPHTPHQGSKHLAAYPWALALEAIAAKATRRNAAGQQPDSSRTRRYPDRPAPTANASGPDC
jgi:phosphopantothenoylcysteine synthetase/decarboxylase